MTEFKTESEPKFSGSWHSYLNLKICPLLKINLYIELKNFLYYLVWIVAYAVIIEQALRAPSIQLHYLE
jgi:hypothetical protein